MAVNVKSRPLTARFGAAAALAAFLFSGCASALIGTAGPNRVIHARITVDKAFASDFSWRDNVAALIRHANGRLESWMSVEIAIDTVFVFTPSEAGGAAGLSEPEILMERVPPGASDIVIHFSREYGIPRDNTLGLTFRENGTIIVRQMEALPGPDPFNLLYFTLLHEMGHLLGAMHVLGDRHSADIMEPAFKRNFFLKDGKTIKIVEPVFHPANVRIMNALRNRPFRRNDWKPSDFENIRAAYAGAVLQYNNLEKDRLAGLGLSNLAFSPLEPPLALSMWASLCGRDTLALAYADSLRKTADELRRFCLYAPKGGGSDEVCGELTQFGNEWYAAVSVLLHFNRAIILVRARRFREAGEEFELFKGKLDARRDTDIPYLTRYYERERMLYGAPAVTDTTTAFPDAVPAAADTTGREDIK